MLAPNLATLYAPRHDEASRQRFVAALKGYANGPLEETLADRYEHALKPAFEVQHGQAPANRSEARPLFEADPLYQLWGSMVYASQGLMWESVDETVRRIQPEFEARARHVTAQPKGSLTLNPQLKIPQPIADAEIHRQPGGYFASANEHDLHTAMLYFGTVELYRAAKGLSANNAAGEPGLGRFIASVLQRRFPALQPKRILDLGCGPGLETIALAETFPEAEIHALDLSAPFLRFAHAWAEDKGHAIHYRQADARETGYPDGHFDLIVSHILFHETWHDIAPVIFAEAHRLLAPRGVFLNADVPYQPARMPIPRQVTNDWQVRNNGEPFWTGFADSDVREWLHCAGFAKDTIVAEYEPLGAGHYYFFGAVRA